MDTKHLRYFCAAAKHEHISKAAEELFITQPALSRIIRQLEEELNVPLFESKGRGVQLTPTGRYLYSVASKSLMELDSAFREIQNRASPSKEGISITNMAPEVCPYLIRDFLSTYPETPVSEFQASGAEPEGADQLLSEFLLAYQPVSYQGYASEKLLESSYGVLAAAEHPLAQMDAITLEQAAKYPHIAYSSPLHLPDSIAEAMSHPDYIISDLHSIARLVSGGSGVAILPQVFWESAKADIAPHFSESVLPKIRPLADVDAALSIYLGTQIPSAETPASACFRAFCKDYFSPAGG